MTLFTLGAFLCSLLALATARDPIEVKGNKFFRKGGSQFFIKGISYQLRPNDPLIDTEQCQRDVKLMKELGANALRVYHVDANVDHDGCMKVFADAGIYLLIDLDTFDTYIVPVHNFWTTRHYTKFAEVMDTFAKYDNVLGFFVGNENIASKEDSLVAPYLKAAARDMKAYRDAKGYRAIPIGYSAADIRVGPMLQNYLACGGNSSESVDFFGLNTYAWCDPGTYTTSGYDQLTEEARNFPVPLFITETGCNVPGPREWADMEAVFDEGRMARDWSGAIMYEWIEEMNHYGIVSYGPPVPKGEPMVDNDIVFDGFTRKGTPTPIHPDFDNLKSRWATLHPTGVSKGDYDPGQVVTPACPTSTQGGWWLVDGNSPLPVLDVIPTRHGAGKVMLQSTETAAVEDGHVQDSDGGQVVEDVYEDSQAAALHISFSATMVLGLCFLWGLGGT